MRRPRLAPSASSKPQSTKMLRWRVADQPDEIVDRVWPVVVVGGDEAFEAAAVGELAILYGEDLRRSRWSRRPPARLGNRLEMGLERRPVTRMSLFPRVAGGWDANYPGGSRCRIGVRNIPVNVFLPPGAARHRRRAEAASCCRARSAVSLPKETLHELAAALLSGRGEASGVAIASAILAATARWSRRAPAPSSAFLAHHAARRRALAAAAKA
jgi:hypothetical protein